MRGVRTRSTSGVSIGMHPRTGSGDVPRGRFHSNRANALVKPFHRYLILSYLDAYGVFIYDTLVAHARMFRFIYQRSSSTPHPHGRDE